MKQTLIILILLALNYNPLCAQKNIQNQGKANLKINFSSPTPTPLQSQYDVNFYKIDLSAMPNSLYLNGNTTISATVTASKLDTFSFHLSGNFSIDSILVSGKKANFLSNLTTSERLVVANGYTQNQTIEVQVFYKGNSPSFGGLLSGVGCSSSFGGETWTLSEPNNAYTWFAVKQDLNDKADSAWIFITTINTHKVGSNGLLEKVVDLPENKHRFEWKTRYPTAFYLLNFSIGKYDEYSFYSHIEQEGIDSLLIMNYIFSDLSETQKVNTKKAIDETDLMMKTFINLWGPYPFAKEKYGHVSSSIGGGMEHQTMSTMGYYYQSIIAHELAHQWFGDNVTCATWGDIWINEGFASYSEILYYEFAKSKETALSALKSIYSSVLSFGASGSVWVPEEDQNNEDRIFSSVLTYDKGAILVHLLRCELDNDDLFFEINKAFQKEYSNRAASGQDYQKFLSEKSGKNMQAFFDQWYYAHGFPIYNIAASTESTNGSYSHTFISSQSGSSNRKTPLFKTKVELLLRFTDKDSLITFYQDTNLVEFSLKNQSELVNIIFNPNLKTFGRASTKVTKVSLDYERKLKSHIYPNPFHSEIHIVNLEEGNYTIKLYDMVGKLLLSELGSGKNNTISTNQLPSGLYFIHLNNGHKTIIHKLIKK